MVSKLLLLNVCGDRPMTAAVVGDAMFVQGSEREFQEWAAADNKYVNRVLQGWIQHKLAIRHHNHILKKKEKQERTAKRQEAWQKYMDEKARANIETSGVVSGTVARGMGQADDARTTRRL